MQSFIQIHGQFRQGQTAANRYNGDRAENNPGQAWVGDRRTVSRGLGREKKPGTRAGIRNRKSGSGN